MAAKPAILAVDDDLPVLRAVERDLRARYGDDYRILAAGSGAEALEVVRELTQRGDPVALFLVDQRMPAMTGIELLAEALPLQPDAKRVLLTAYADTDVAIRAINEIRLDQYLLKPWDPPEERLYPVLDDLLADWVANFRPPFEGLRLLAADGRRAGTSIRDFLTRNQVPYAWLDPDRGRGAPPGRDRSTAALDASRAGGAAAPTGACCAIRRSASSPRRVGLSTHAALPFYDLVIVGAGRPGWPPRCTDPARGCRRSSSSARRPGARPAPRAGSRTTSASRRA